MIVFTKYPYPFKKPDSDETFTITPDRRCEVPDWVAESELFKMAVANGRIKILEAQSAASLAKLRAEAKALGVANASRIGEKRLAAEIATVKERQITVGE